MVTLRRHQAEAREALRAAHARGAERAWVVLPPGAGKTALGVDHALWLGRKTVVLCPNTAIVGQWIDTWNRLAPEDAGPAGDDRELTRRCTVLTYQSLAVFDAESDEPGLARLHENGRALVERLHGAGPLTIVLDECHHLLQAWGALLDELIGDMEGECVLALTATPPDRLNRSEAELIGRLFGEVAYAASIPAVVGAGDLAPFAELAWIATPTPTESAWLDARAERAAEFLAVVTDPSLTDLGLLTWLDLRFVEPRSGSGVRGRSWAEVERDDPALADAVIRIARGGHCRLPEGAAVSERHRREAGIEDWMPVIDDWLAHHLDARDPAAAARVRAGLPAVGFRSTRHGIRQGPSLVDRVLGRSESKARGAVEIVAHALATGDPRLLVLCDHATATTLPSDLAGVLPETAGSARRMLELLLADERTTLANPVLVTGATVAASPETAAALARFAAERDPRLAGRVTVEEEQEGLAVLAGWTSKQWTPAVTAFLEAGRSRCLVGTRALLGEGWDARGITGVIDAGTATTTTAVVQTRGRSLRVDPDRPGKTAVNWTLTCIAPGRPQGDADWRRLVRKHEGWFAVDEFGDVVDGVAHLDSRLSPYRMPAVDELPALQARALRRSEDTDVATAAWAAVAADRTHPLATLRVRGAGLAGADRLPVAVRRDGTVARPDARAPRGALAAWAGGAVLAAAGATWLAPWLLGPALVLLVVAGLGSTARLGARRLADASVRPGLAAYAAAVADALRAEGLSPVGAEGVAVEVTPDGEYRCRLDGVSEPVSEIFAVALNELLTPIARPRYLVSRPVTDPRSGLPASLRAGARGVRPDRLVWHQVPAVFGGSRAAADRFAAAWRARLGAGAAVYTGTPEGQSLLIAHRGASPVDDVSAVIRRQW